MRHLKTEFKAAANKKDVLPVIEKLTTTPMTFKEKEPSSEMVMVDGELEPKMVTKDVSRQVRLYWVQSNNDDKLPRLDFMLRNRVNGLWRNKDLMNYCLVLARLGEGPKIRMLVMVHAPIAEEIPKMLRDEGWTESFDWKLLKFEDFTEFYLGMTSDEEYLTIL